MLVLEIIQSVAICGSLIATVVITIITMYTNKKARKVDNSNKINEAHRNLWLQGILSGKIDRLDQDNIDLVSSPITAEEARFAKLVFLHTQNSFKQIKNNACLPVEEFEKDVKNFLKHPIPRAVWNNSHVYYNGDFVNFVKKLID